MKLKAIVIGISCLLLLKCPVQAQDSVRCGRWISINLHYGFIPPAYNSSMAYLIKAHVPGIEADYLFKPLGNRPWQRNFHYPETGVAVFYAWLGNPAELGNMMGAYPFINFHLQRSTREKLYLRIGIGLGYLPVNFNQQTNHKDEVIGSHINAMVNIRFTNHFYLSNNLRLETGLGVTHCSDGSYKTPNLGINLLTVNAGLSYCLNPYKTVAVPYADTAHRKYLSNELFLGFGTSQIEPPGGSRYGAATLSYIAYHIINAKNKLGLGLDVFYNSANIAAMKGIDSAYVSTPAQNIQLGIKAGYELMAGKLGLPLEIGSYIYTRSKEHGYEYNRIGIRYYASKHFIASITLLTHFASADYIEWGAGYKL